MSQSKDTHSAISLPFLLNLLRKLPVPRKLGILERIFGRGLSVHGLCWVEASNGVVWKLDLEDPTHRWIVYGDYEGPVQMTWIRNWLYRGGVVIDSGSNIGQMLVYMAPICGVKIYAFEPLPCSAGILDECLSRYPDWDVNLVNKGLSAEKGSVTVQVDGARSTSRLDWYQGKMLPRIEISVDRLDAFAEATGISRIRLWKLDVEGAEVEAIRGADRLLKNYAIDAILVEISSNSKEVIGLLNDYGYDIFCIKPHRLELVIDKGVGNRNVVALPSKPTSST